MFLFKSGKHSQKYYFCQKAEKIIQADSCAEVIAALIEIEALQQQGYTLAGWISYEASQAFDQRHQVRSDGEFPLVYMMASRDVQLISLDQLNTSSEKPSSHIKAHINQQQYEDSCSKVLDYIKSGDIYQANYSFRCDVEVSTSALELFKSLEEDHPVPYSFYIDNGDWQIVSQSPELFLQKTGNKIISKPMKGTIRRGKSFEEDEALRKQLSEDLKSQAENVMIVDLMRNDFSRICHLNSINVPELFNATRYGTLHQLTSTVEGDLKENAGLVEVLSAAFPPGSITGAPKIRAMEVIHELEKDGRKLYTGSAGMFYPNGDFTLNVCIRTLIFNNGKTELGIGSGIVADSAKTLEWEECLLKSSFLHCQKKHRSLFETMLWENGTIHLLEEHMQRLLNSCAYFLIPLDIREAKRSLTQLSFQSTQRIKISVYTDGTFAIESSPIQTEGWGKKELSLKVSDKLLNPENAYLYHKTDYRALYSEEFKCALESGADEVLFLNENKEVCEGAISNIFIRKNEQWSTPKLSCGLLPGTWRQHMIKELKAQCTVLSLGDIKNADEVIIGNSVRLTGTVKKIL